MPVVKKHATETLAPVALLAKTLCSELMNLSFVISCMHKENFEPIGRF